MKKIIKIRIKKRGSVGWIWNEGEWGEAEGNEKNEIKIEYISVYMNKKKIEEQTVTALGFVSSRTLSGAFYSLGSYPGCLIGLVLDRPVW